MARMRVSWFSDPCFEHAVGVPWRPDGDIESCIEGRGKYKLKIFTAINTTINLITNNSTNEDGSHG